MSNEVRNATINDTRYELRVGDVVAHQLREGVPIKATFITELECTLHLSNSYGVLYPYDSLTEVLWQPNFEQRREIRRILALAPNDPVRVPLVQSMLSGWQAVLDEQTQTSKPRWAVSRSVSSHLQSLVAPPVFCRGGLEFLD